MLVSICNLRKKKRKTVFRISDDKSSADRHWCTHGARFNQDGDYKKNADSLHHAKLIDFTKNQFDHFGWRIRMIWIGAVFDLDADGSGLFIISNIWKDSVSDRRLDMSWQTFAIFCSALKLCVRCRLGSRDQKKDRGCQLHTWHLFIWINSCLCSSISPITQPPRAK